MSVLERLDSLASISDVDGEITRLYLTDAHLRAVHLVRGWMEQAGLATHLDGAATLIGRREGPHPNSPTLILGSHIDTVRNAGRFDGCLGVAVAIEAAERLSDTALPYALEIRAFGDEEGIRFPVTLTGARATAGIFDPAALQAADSDGVSLAQALLAWNLSPSMLAENRLWCRTAFAYLELHIEQGPVLDRMNLPLGIVTAINGATRLRVTLTGESGHAGTVPMAHRRDPLVAAAAAIAGIPGLAGAFSSAVATVGQIAVRPNAVNVIPGECVFSVDIRAPDDAARFALREIVVHTIHSQATQRDVAASIEQTHEAPAVACDTRMQSALAAAFTEAGYDVHYLPSGAGHDAMAMAALCPVGMLFIRCDGGISHHPAESVRSDDVAASIDILCRTLNRLDPSAFMKPLEKD